MRKFPAAFLVLGLLVVRPGSVGAQSASEIAAAKQWFTEGLALEEKSDFAAALERFRRAAEVKRTPAITFHVGLCEMKTGALVEAVVSLERTVESAKAEGNTQVETAAANELSALRARLPMLEISIKGAAKPTTLSLDGNSLSVVALDAPIPVNPGQHKLVAEFATGPLEKSFSASEGKRARVELTAPGSPAEATRPPVPPATPAAPAPSPAPDKDATNDAGGASVVPWLFIGGGVLATAGGFYMWKLRGDLIDDLDAICPAQTECPADRADDVDSKEKKGKTYTTLGVAFWGVGVAALATGGYLLLSAPTKERPTALRVAPALGPHVAGALINGRF
ncbi:MAG: hypothetical protein IPI67_07105 [Myxococcales bacterium]|nr:hypothetical protein [Myxococcales bacterium]